MGQKARLHIVSYDTFPFLSKVFAQSKTILTNSELYEFLKIAKNQTKTVITLTGKPGEENSKYMLAVSTV